MTIRKKFRSALLQWNQLDNNRQMPWKGEKDPYKIWLSEIILQQTRVEQGRAYYERFIERFPTIHDLAATRDEDAFKLWEGLGYYNRCKNLLFTARYITKNYNGNFPDTYPDIVALKGIGPYTAAAIASFAFNLPYAVLDGNVFRVLSRVFGIDTPIDSTQGKTIFAELAQEVLDDTRAGEFNQAIMDFGATICKPLAPLCAACPMHRFCEAYRHGNVNTLPVKQKLLQKKTRWFSWFVLRVNDKLFIRKRGSGDIWENLHEFYLVETPAQPHWNKQELDAWLKNQLAVNRYELENVGPVISQQLTHQTIKAQVLTLRLSKIPESLQESEWLSYDKVAQLAFPKLLSQWLAGWKQ